MFARRLEIPHRDKEYRTPMLVPSFSSKGFQDIDPIMAFMEEIITDQILISAYDLHYQNIVVPSEFAELMFLDSGGYEAAKREDLADLGYGDYEPEPWDEAMLHGVLAKWPQDRPTVAVSYDHPRRREKVSMQIDAANALFVEFPSLIKEILLKPETRTQRLLQIDSIIGQIDKLGDFDIVGVTERELGSCIIDRMTAIARLRRAMDAAEIIKPIHVFGSLDPVTSPLYFLSGADIFDGLSWLRFSYMDGFAVYRQIYGALKLGIRERESRVVLRSYASNIYYLTDLRTQMERYVLTGDFDQFKHHATFFRETVTDLQVKLSEVK